MTDLLTRRYIITEDSIILEKFFIYKKIFELDGVAWVEGIDAESFFDSSYTVVHFKGGNELRVTKLACQEDFRSVLENARSANKKR